MLRIGLTGGIACGKSTVAEMLMQKGALLLDADLIAREVVEPGQAAWHEIISWLGEDVLKDDRTLDRLKIASLVFADYEALQKLNSITHPRILEFFITKSRLLAEEHPDALQIWDVPLLFEINMHNEVERVMVVAADQEVQISRIAERDGFSREEALRRIASQMDLQEKIRLADYVIYNNSTKELLQEQIDAVWEKLWHG